MKKFRHFYYIPMTGLGLYGGHRGRRWLRSRIKILKQFVIPSLEAQTNQDFAVWLSARPQDKNDKDLKELVSYLEARFPERVAFTYGGLCFWDDKYDDETAWNRLAQALHLSTSQLIDYIGDVKDILMTIQPSDDMYNRRHAENFQKLFAETDYNAIGYTQGYIMNLRTKEAREYNPETNPPFFTIRIPKDVFLDPYKHMKWIGPYKSHEYIGDALKYLAIPERGFIVGTHGENVSTHFNHPYGGKKVEGIEERFGIEHVEPLKLKASLRKALMRKLPHGWQRKLRYLLGEKGFARFYNWIRN